MRSKQSVQTISLNYNLASYIFYKFFIKKVCIKNQKGGDSSHLLDDFIIIILNFFMA